MKKKTHLKGTRKKILQEPIERMTLPPLLPSVPVTSEADQQGASHRSEEVTRWQRLRSLIIGAPKDLWDGSIFHKVALIPVLAWVGMGADGLSSSAYGPEEMFKVLGEHQYLTPILIVATVWTITIISIAYSRIIEHFPSGGGGYVVASKLLGPTAGLVSGCALMIDYVLTITVSVAAGGDALFSLLPPSMVWAKFGTEIFAIMALIMLNLRGVKESVIAVAPIFFAFVISHAIMLIVSLAGHVSAVPQTTVAVVTGLSDGWHTVGAWGLFAILLHAFSLGAGTFTGIEAVSNGVGTLRDPKVETGKRTMFYMAASLAITSAGLLLVYLLIGIRPVEGQTLNAVLANDTFGKGVLGSIHFGAILIGISLVSEAGLLLIAAQTGFIDGPRVMANMAVDHWLPKRFSALSERLAMQNGVLIFGLGALAALLLTKGVTHVLVLLYSIHVFITFCLSEFSMLKMYWSHRKEQTDWSKKIRIHIAGFIVCLTMLIIMIGEKFKGGGWVTFPILGGLIALCWWIRHYYRTVQTKTRRLDEQLKDLPLYSEPTQRTPNPQEPTAILLVENYGGVGVHSLFSIFQSFGGYFKNVVFVSVGVVDSGSFKGAEALQELQRHVESDLKRYVELGRRIGVPSSFEMEVGTEAVETATALCLKVSKRFPRVVVFGSKLVFQRERWYQGLLHSETAEAIQRRLQWEGLPMTILPIRVFG